MAKHLTLPLTRGQPHDGSNTSHQQNQRVTAVFDEPAYLPEILLNGRATIASMAGPTPKEALQ